MKTVSDFEIGEGEVIPFTLTWHPSHLGQPDAIDGDWAVENTERRWAEWSTACAYDGDWRPQVVRSLITLKALTFEETGAICAAPTTSLPEDLGGERNWDYRYCWLRDAALSIDALMLGGYTEEAMAFGAWLQRATASHPSQAQILYGLGGERTPERGDARLAARVRGLDAGAHRQRRLGAVPARRVRRAARRRRPLPLAQRQDRPGRMASADRRPRTT